jgi:bifunctional DNA-binding transcriptional regulator/antitoxin component of YhaV-PrlF toxin-antitoxin module
MSTFEEVRTITADGRLIVPWIVQRALGLEHGGPVRFCVDGGVVTLLSVEGRKPGVVEANGGGPRPNDIRSALKQELDTLLSATERDHAKAAVIE